jgi:AcrR family transcriptional regulator
MVIVERVGKNQRRGSAEQTGTASPAPAKRENDGARKPSKRDAEVLEAAIKVFYERGYADATVQDIANEVGILKGSLYHYISTKEDLLFRLFDLVHDEVQRILEEAEAAPDLNPIERLELYVLRQVEYNVSNLERISIYYHDLGLLSAGRLEVVQSKRREHNRAVTRMIREAQEQGLADPTLDARMLANCVFGTIIWTYRWYRPDSGMSRTAVAELCQVFAVQGIRAAAGAGATR